jgi:hypothetical protein
MGVIRMPVILDPDRYDVLRTMTKSVQHPWNLNRLRIGFSLNWLMLSCPESAIRQVNAEHE